MLVHADDKLVDQEGGAGRGAFAFTINRKTSKIVRGDEKKEVFRRFIRQVVHVR
jgi:hypothetical protein